MKVSLKIYLAVFLSLLFFTQCKRDKNFEQYKELVKAETSSGKRVDSIFFGLYFGMTSKEFFMHCWDLNKKGLFTDGENNNAVLYKLDHNELDYPASLNFYPRFANNRISNMVATFQYNAWAPWNKQLFADSLLPRILKLYKQWYSNGNPFLEINDPVKKTIYVKVDGNRRITIGKSDDMIVKVDYTDLLTELKTKK